MVTLGLRELAIVFSLRKREFYTADINRNSIFPRINSFDNDYDKTFTENALISQSSTFPVNLIKVKNFRLVTILTITHMTQNFHDAYVIYRDEEEEAS